MSSNWKKVELSHCRELGGERTGPTGRDLPDCTGTPLIGLEIKAYKKFVFFTADWDQAVRNAAKLDVVPVLLVREGGRGGRRRVQMRLFDYNAMASDLVWELKGPASLVWVGDDHLIRFEWSDFVDMYQAVITEIDRQVKEDT